MRTPITPLRLTAEDLRALDALRAKYGVASRAETVRRAVREALAERRKPRGVRKS